jgi:hypothetical protein
MCIEALMWIVTGGAVQFEREGAVEVMEEVSDSGSRTRMGGGLVV